MINPSSRSGRPDPEVTIRRILKVNHAGEFGAIRIYGAQILVARRLFPDIVPALEEMRRDEIDHCRLFRAAMPARIAKPCRVMEFWSLGGSVLGFLTALAGRNMIWICTEAVESTVHRHLEDQLAFLAKRDPELHALIASIQEQELAHLRTAESSQKGRGLSHALLLPVVGALTDLMIWLSTWGDSSWMRAEMARVRRG
ncbi:demethoxyubiquinone hydroxylase family protein [Rhizobium leguminosarum]|uniref:demethoxyubiquinone hydroxylase family protein n=1 Tax=Rhizobium leguminosarum TaxID=384 RepID=UPI00144176B1|nr:demethoxyubiquinone hydroxylase family protein [Rhizobium leguminosarum]NKK68071.1 demethoxyubiquinone hydroxylase family protein [Rhizobium leguminosarum bv. viciae]NKL09597.1 demethoxyubiquinone hydroxylase family protein [Rhizobium leguminosarum bv. viciae]NKL87735.1 demethoxyubiquinone hydroxylase family protein [Rhizobium leguminosarum bv. viciae]NKL94834.1 demethoxyubiquinone hydroxylase family protein [Rhizobium leguminosarum bv. viciae]NKM95613.1 demethoxyubiquinone hydroxylase fami